MAIAFISLLTDCYFHRHCFTTSHHSRKKVLISLWEMTKKSQNPKNVWFFTSWPSFFLLQSRSQHMFFAMKYRGNKCFFDPLNCILKTDLIRVSWTKISVFLFYFALICTMDINLTLTSKIYFPMSYCFPFQLLCQKLMQLEQFCTSVFFGIVIYFPLIITTYRDGEKEDCNEQHRLFYIFEFTF